MAKKITLLLNTSPYNAVYASRNMNNSSLYVLRDEIQLRGINENEVSGKIIDYPRLIDLMTETDKVAGFF